jgi:hypothetical protein
LNEAAAAAAGFCGYLAVEEFLRRFLLHLLPPGFVRIRTFGFLANRNRATLLPLCLRLLDGSDEKTASQPSVEELTHSGTVQFGGDLEGCPENLGGDRITCRVPRGSRGRATPSACAGGRANKYAARQAASG